MAKSPIAWQSKPEGSDYQGALSYLSLLYPERDAHALLSALYRARVIERAAKDLLRASELPLLEDTDLHVAADLKRIRKGKSLPPILLIQGDMRRGLPLVVADGYHRICAVYHYEETAPISCRMVAAPPPARTDSLSRPRRRRSLA